MKRHWTLNLRMPTDAEVVAYMERTSRPQVYGAEYPGYLYDTTAPEVLEAADAWIDHPTIETAKRLRHAVMARRHSP